jgi:hypothetical protein
MAKSPFEIVLSCEERAELERRVACYTLPHKVVRRAKMILYAAQSNAEIARRLETAAEVVGRWRKRFFEERLAGLDDRKRTGRPRRFPPGAGRPGESDRLRAAAHRFWVFPTDPAFLERAGPVLDLYQGRWEGKLLHPGEFVICADEKPSIQARRRIHETRPPAARSRGHRVEHSYERRGALTYLAALDIGRRGGRRPRVFGRSEPRGGIAPFDRLVWQVMTKEPYASARRVF